MFDFLASKQKQRQKAALEMCAVFVLAAKGGLRLLRKEFNLSPESKETLVCGLLLTGAIDCICQAFEQNEYVWAAAIEMAVTQLDLPRELALYFVVLNQRIEPGQAEFQIILDGGNLARKWLSDKNNSMMPFGIGKMIDPHIENKKIPESMGHIIAKYKIHEYLKSMNQNTI